MKQLILGAGNMVQALVPPYIKASQNSDFSVYTPSGKSAVLFATENKIGTFEKDRREKFDVLWLGMKPQQLLEAVKDFKKNISEETIIISLLAGTSTQEIESSFGSSRIIRIMPNTPAKVGLGVNATYMTDSVPPTFWQLFKVEFGASGKVFEQKTEEDLDIITPYSGSGPAYFFEIIRIMTHDLSSRGIDKDMAKEMIALTMKGSAELCLNSSDDPEVLRNNVTSKGGVTFEALKVLKENNLEKIFVEAMNSALKRVSELKGE